MAVAAVAVAVASAGMTTSRSDRLLVMLGAAALGMAPGCTYTVRMLSDPSGATITLPDGEQVATPAEYTFRWKAGGQPLLIEAPGYLPLQVDMQRTEGTPARLIGGAFSPRGGREVTFLLQPVSAPIGSGPQP